MRGAQRSRIVKATGWVMLGNVAPMIVALAVVPFLLQRLGQERLGVLSLVWVLVGYFSFLDMGLGRAVTVAVAAWRAQHPDERGQELQILGSAGAALGGLGLAVALLLGLAACAWGLPAHFSSPQIEAESLRAVLVMLPGLPLLLLSSILRGHMEGTGAFRSLNLVRMPTGVLLLAAPCLTALVTPSLVWACAAILVVRAGNVLALAVLVARDMGLAPAALALALAGGGDRAWLGRLLSFGGWVTVSNVVGPVIVYLDRFVIGTLMTAAAVAFYSVPFDVIARLPVLVASLCSVLLPELARQAFGPAAGGMQASRRLVRKASLASAAVVAALVGFGIALAPLALAWWLGADFADRSALLARVLLLAFGINALAQIPFTALQAAGCARAVALLHLAELLPYAGMLIWAVGAFGLAGAAWAWTLRGLIDYAALAWLWHRQSSRGNGSSTLAPDGRCPGAGGAGAGEAGRHSASRA
jgi:O-antigen/teichoic acid export membrane protein